MSEKDEGGMPFLIKEIAFPSEGNKKFPFFEIVGKFDKSLSAFNGAARCGWSDELFSVEIIDGKIHTLLKRWDENYEGDMASWTVAEDYDSWSEFANDYPWNEYFERGKFGLLFESDAKRTKEKEEE